MENRRFEDRIILNEGLRRGLYHVTEVALRLPGVLLLEIWWRNRDFRITPEMIQNSPFSTYLDVKKILEFIQTRNFDQSASLILSYAVVFLFSVFLSLPLKKLVRVYAHVISLFLFGVAHYLSIRYIRMEKDGDPELRLDDIKKLEWHGSHIMAQLMLCVAQSCLLGLENDVERVMLSVFLIPILVRMCGISLERLMLAHNLACALAMLSICIYALNRAPKLLNSTRQSYRSLKAVIANRGVVDGLVTVWHSLYFGELLSCAWIFIFCVQTYVHLINKHYELRELGSLILPIIAESTNTPLSLLALALTVRYACKIVVYLMRWAIGGNHESNHFLVHAGYTEVLTLVLLCSQTGFLGMPIGQKAFLLGLVLLIVMSSLLQSLYELLEPRLLELGATPLLSFERHIRSLALAIALFGSAALMALVITRYLSIDFWCVVIVSDSILTALRTLSVTVVYALIVVETQKPEFWEPCDDLIFFTKIGTRILELGFALFLVVYGIYSSIKEGLSLVIVLVLIFHTYFNIWQRIQGILSSLRTRRAALRNLSRLPRASISVLEKKKDICAICCEKMSSEARITPCKHFFHGACLKKWLSVKQVCPLCYAAVSLDSEDETRHNSSRRRDAGVLPYSYTRSAQPFVGSDEDESSDWDSDSSLSDFSEFTVVSSDDTDSTA